MEATKGGVVNVDSGSALFEEAKLVDIVCAFISTVTNAMPPRGYEKEISQSSIMYLGVKLDLAAASGEYALTLEQNDLTPGGAYYPGFFLHNAA